ncbi:ABC transporter ATP-binding protein, partial [Citrobacter sp. AAK_AS5]
MDSLGAPPAPRDGATSAIRLDAVRIAFRLEGGGTYDAVAETSLEVAE